MPTTTTRSAWPNASLRARVTSSGWPAGSTPRPIPLVMTGIAGGLGQPERRVLGAVGPDVRADDQHRSLGAGEQGDRPATRRPGRARAARAPAARGAATSARLKNWSIGTSRNTGPRCGAVASRSASSTSSATASTVLDGGGPLGDRREQRRVVELLQAAGAPAEGRRAAADDEQRRPVEPRAGHRADAVGHARAGRQHGEPGRAGQLGGRLGGEHRGLLVPDVEQPHRRIGLHRAVVHREDVRTGEGEHRLDAVGARDRDRMVTAVSVNHARDCTRSVSVHDLRDVLQPRVVRSRRRTRPAWCGPRPPAPSWPGRCSVAMTHTIRFASSARKPA